MQATQAWAQTSLNLQPSYHLQAQFLSPLLGQLVSGCRSMWLEPPLLAAPNLVGFLDLARPQRVLVSGTHADGAATGSSLTGCTSLQRLSCCNGIVPQGLPPSLRELTVDFDGYNSHLATALLHSLQGLASLALLSLSFLDPHARLPKHFPRLASLRKLSFDIVDEHAERAGSLSALNEAAAGQDICIVLKVHFLESTLEEEYDLLAWDAEMPVQDRESVWAALAQLPLLDELHLVDVESSYTQPPSSREQELLGLVSCKQLVLHPGFWLPSTPRLLHRVQCDTLLCHHRASSPSQRTIPWAWLSARPGWYILDPAQADLVVIGCAGVLPDFAQPWGLVIRSAGADRVHGVALGLFKPGPQGCLVWGNSVASDAGLLAALAKLNLVDG